VNSASPTATDPFSGEPTRRDFLYVATAAVGALGALSTLVPLIDQMNPDASTLAAGGPVDLDLGKVQPGQQVTVRWRERPIFVVNRTPEILRTLQDPKLVAELADPDSRERQQPPYADNWHRSVKPEFGVLVGICTHLGCIPLFEPCRRRHNPPQTGQAAIFVPVTARNTISPAASFGAFPRPIICRFRHITS
jgi:ubiquinol-cytochrome c reductase iron-sulfur subunit